MFSSTSRYDDMFWPVLGLDTAMLICLILAIIGGVVVLVTFLPENKEHKYSGFVLWLYKLLNFRKMISMVILKFLHVATLIYVILFGITVIIPLSLFGGILFIIIGVLVVRITYEFLTLIFSMHDNLSRINNNTTQLLVKSQGISECDQTQPNADQE